jgi:DNA-binding response OmpR family regulator
MSTQRYEPDHSSSVQLSLTQAGYTAIAAPDGVGGVRPWQEPWRTWSSATSSCPSATASRPWKEIRPAGALAKILAMTGFRSDSSPEFPALLLGAADVLTELFGPELLLAKLDAPLQACAADDGGCLTSP